MAAGRATAYWALAAVTGGICLTMLPVPVEAQEPAAGSVKAQSVAGFALEAASLNADYDFISLLPEGADSPVSAYLTAPATVPAAAEWRLVTPARSGLDLEDVAHARRFVGRSREVGAPLGRIGSSEAASENAAVQLALWELLETGSSDDVLDETLRSRAEDLLDSTDRPSPAGDPRRAERVAFQLRGEQRQRGGDVRLTVRLVDDSDRPVANELVRITGDGTTVARLTDPNGEGHVVVDIPSSDMDYTGSWSTRLQPGALFLCVTCESGVVAVTADGFPVSRETDSIAVAPASESWQAIVESSINLVLARGSESALSNSVVIVVAAGAVIVAAAGLIALMQVIFTDKPATSGRRVAISALLALGLLFLYNYNEVRKRDPAVVAPRLEGDRAPIKYLPVDTAASSSEREPAERCYSAAMAFDRDPMTAWVSEAGRGTIPMLTVGFDAPYWVTGVTLINGVQRDQRSLDRNGKPLSLEVLGDHGWYTRVANLSERLGEKSYKFDQPLLTYHLLIRVSEVNLGWNSAGITEARFYGVPAAPAEVEQLDTYYGNESGRPPGYVGIASTAYKCGAAS